MQKFAGLFPEFPLCVSQAERCTLGAESPGTMDMCVNVVFAAAGKFNVLDVGPLLLGDLPPPTRDVRPGKRFSSLNSHISARAFIFAPGLEEL
jgi:hypothetical protein